MIEGLISLAWSGFTGGEIGKLLEQWQQAGVFSYLLPFLLIFAMIVAVLGRMKLFKEKSAISVIIALVVALMALQFEFVPDFFSQVFPRLGVGLAILLVAMIMIMLFVDTDKQPGVVYGLLIVGVIATIVILIQAGGATGQSVGTFFQDNWGTAIGVILIIAVFVMIIASGMKPPKPKRVSVPISTD